MSRAALSKELAGDPLRVDEFAHLLHGDNLPLLPTLLGGFFTRVNSQHDPVTQRVCLNSACFRVRTT